MQVFIENPSGTALKKEFEKGKWKEVGNLAVPYPYPYGFIPKTRQKDGDPLDAFVITSTPSRIKRGNLIDAHVLGIAEFFEDGKRDSKILATRTSEKIQLSHNIKDAIKGFLLHAFDNNPGKKIKFNGFGGKAKAKAEVSKCMRKGK